MTNLHTKEKASLVGAVNEVSDKIGDMTQLADGVKKDGGNTTLVDAINNAYNAAKAESGQSIKEVDEKVTQNTNAIGNIGSLQTKSENLVDAVNVVNGKVDAVDNKIGDVRDLKDLNKDIKESDSTARSADVPSNLVEAVNIVNKKVETASGAVGDVNDLDADIQSNTVVGATNNLNHKVDRLGSRLNKVGAGAAALAALHPMDYDPEDKLSFAAGFGNYGGENAFALGAFYRPNENVMFNIGGNMGNGENMVNAGVSFALGSGSHGTTSKAAMAQKLAVQDEEISQLHAKLEEEHAKDVQQGAMIEEQNARIEKLEALIQQLANK